MPDSAAGGLSIHYAAAPHEPRSPALVLLHGAGANHSIWLGQLRDLRERSWIVLPDLPGHGRSAAIAGRSIEEYAAALIPFLEEVEQRARAATEAAARPAGRAGQEEPAVQTAMPAGGIYLGGHSMGGAIALEVALARPRLVRGLILVGSSARFEVSPRILEGLERAPSETQALIARWSFAASADPALIVRTVRDLAGTPAERTLADFEACSRFDATGRLAAIAAPVLVLCGTEDRMTPPARSEGLAQALPRATVSLIAGAGHSVMIEAAAAVSAAIGTFIGS